MLRSSGQRPSADALLARWGGWGAVAAGAVLCAIGWYGVSGERYAERQIPYLASCTVPGAALIVAGAVLLSALGAARRGGAENSAEGAHAGRPAADTDADARDRRTGSTDSRDSMGSTDSTLVAVPEGTLAHRADCPLVDGKPQAAPVDGPVLRERGLRPCPICEPELPDVPEVPEHPG
ncbi:hypothetical protein [Streptomyces boncukensis]|uniref:Uncharacterized protein n=1 Tax=Streptomyces boncukensis TaxID=2711219 RepID=A0A6G4WTJ8_9ACTN|nr:hypothetical protein [Streptomyces boncukensis]NGO68172.1 hypothetical protein [Streptomyces boncukensis]